MRTLKECQREFEELERLTLQILEALLYSRGLHADDHAKLVAARNIYDLLKRQRDDDGA